MDTLDFSLNSYKRKFSNSFSQKTLLGTFKHKHKHKHKHNHKVGSFIKQETTTTLMNLFIKNYGQIDNKNIVAVSEDNQSTDILLSKTTDVRDRNEMMKKIINNINSLDVSIRLAFDMYRNGYNFSQIAASFNIPIETVTERVHYAKKVVRETIKENYSDYNSLRALTA